MKNLSIKNGHLEFFYKLLDKPKHGKEARVKNRFLKLIIPRIQEIEKERIALLTNYSDKKGGKPVMLDTNYSLSPSNLEKFKKEYTEYLMEDLIIDILPSNKDDIKAIKKMLEEDTIELTTENGATYDIIMTMFDEAGL